VATLFVKTERGREVRMLQIVVPGLGRKTIRVGQLPQRAAERFRDKVEVLVDCRRLNQAPDPDLVAWMAGVDDGAYNALAAAGLAEPRAPLTRMPTLGAFIDKHIAQKTGTVAPRSIQLLEQTKARLVARFGSATPLDKITADGALDWRAAMLEDGLSEATVRLHTRNAKTVFNDAVERELISRNPFRKLPSAAVAAEHDFYVTTEMAEKVLAHLPDHRWRLFFGLGRYAGLRLPSESHILTWDQVDLQRRRLTVYAPKTGATRTVPIVPALAELLREAKARSPQGETRVLPLTASNLHRRVHEAIEAAGLEPWEDLFQALRRSAETDFASKFPAHAAAAWLGHGVAVSAKHYLQVPDAMLDQAAGLTGRVDPARQQRPTTRRRHPANQAA
jgi:integrase